ncbi:MAG: hypothetical protein V4441_10580 [Pseudomonadota bacterium]
MHSCSHTGRKAALVFILSVLSAAPALAANMDIRFANTVEGLRPDETKIRLFFNADKTFTGTAKPHGGFLSFDFSGTWRMDGDKLCVLQTEGRGKNLDIEKCDPLQGDKIGDTWKVMVSDQDDKPVEQTMTIIESR